MPKWSDNINHLAYADDIIIFTSADPVSLGLIMQTLGRYEKKSGVKEITRFARGMLPLIYLGCPIGHARRRKVHFFELIKKVQSKLQLWKRKLLYFRGKVLINSVLQKFFAKFLWNFKEDGRNKHWVASEDCCLPKNKSGLGFRSMFDVSKILFAKLWWNFRTKKSLWANFFGTNNVNHIDHKW
ncbi:hypothetical protein H5410_056737 [Solanum commersonii]|uniref:Uncharacterized protein n=1 Tax=Solanum commersonii TaxID=4109 RepID=A0A9J5WL34_SOLCO|nr:hypothetical protein H5410_056737 [Solanum commersonii]